jgi:hypothetical protein
VVAGAPSLARRSLGAMATRNLKVRVIKVQYPPSSINIQRNRYLLHPARNTDSDKPTKCQKLQGKISMSFLALPFDERLEELPAAILRLCISLKHISRLHTARTNRNFHTAAQIGPTTSQTPTPTQTLYHNPLQPSTRMAPRLQSPTA